MTSPEARSEAIVAQLRGILTPEIDMDYLDKTSDFLHSQGWSYGLIRYLDTVTGPLLVAYCFSIHRQRKHLN